jgi:Carboxypeptidase regulatory-like domain
MQLLKTTRSWCVTARRLALVLSMTWGALWLIEPAFPQLNFGQISGAVTDSSGSVVPNAAVVITDVARGVSRALTTDSAGLYSAPSLVPGTYNGTGYGAGL